MCGGLTGLNRFLGHSLSVGYLTLTCHYFSSYYRFENSYSLMEQIYPHLYKHCKSTCLPKRRMEASVSINPRPAGGGGRLNACLLDEVIYTWIFDLTSRSFFHPHYKLFNSVIFTLAQAFLSLGRHLRSPVIANNR